MKVVVKTYSEMKLVLYAGVDSDGNVTPSTSITTIIPFDGMETIADLYDQVHIQEGNDKIIYHVGDRKLIMDWDYGMKLRNISDQLFWEYQELANPEIAELLASEKKLLSS